MFKFMGIPQKVTFSKTKKGQIAALLKNAKIEAKKSELNTAALSADASGQSRNIQVF